MTIEEKLALADKRRAAYGNNLEALTIKNLADLGGRIIDAEHPKRCGTCVHLDDEKVPGECRVRRRRGEYYRVAILRAACEKYKEKKDAGK